MTRCIAQHTPPGPPCPGRKDDTQRKEIARTGDMIHEYVTGRKITYMRPTSDGKHIICDPLDPRGWARDNVETGATAPRYTRADHLLDAADKIIKDGKADTFIIQYLNRHGYRRRVNRDNCYNKGEGVFSTPKVKR